MCLLSSQFLMTGDETVCSGCWWQPLLALPCSLPTAVMAGIKQCEVLTCQSFLMRPTKL